METLLTVTKTWLVLWHSWTGQKLPQIMVYNFIFCHQTCLYPFMTLEIYNMSYFLTHLFTFEAWEVGHSLLPL